MHKPKAIHQYYLRSIKETEERIKKLNTEKRDIETKIDTLERQKKQMEILTFALSDETGLELKIRCYHDCVELHFKNKVPQEKYKEVEQQAGKIMAMWVQEHNPITPGLMVYWKNGCLIYRFAVDEQTAVYFKTALGEDESNIIF